MNMTAGNQPASLSSNTKHTVCWKLCRLTWIQRNQGFHTTMMEGIWLDGAPLQVDKSDLQDAKSNVSMDCACFNNMQA